MLLQNLIQKSTRLTLGLMSGTSADGLDIAACEVDTSDRKVTTIAAATYPYPESLRNAVLRLSSLKSVEVKELMLISLELGFYYAQMVTRFLDEQRLERNLIDLIGSHGQTVAHLGDKHTVSAGSSFATLQLGEADIIAKQTGIVTVADFRQGDIAVGGSGAPLAPAYHALRFAKKGECRAVVNIGGVANVTLLKSDGTVAGSDSGPGNCLLDFHMKRNSEKKYDQNGEVAARGGVNEKLVKKLKSHRLLSRSIPRSYDRHELVSLLEDEEIKQAIVALNLEDTMASFSYLTASTIKDTLRALSGDEWPKLVLICGGGALNQHLMQTLADLLKPAIVESTARHGSNPEFVEAEAFAYFANLTLDSMAANLPEVTGAERPVILGKVVQP